MKADVKGNAHRLAYTLKQFAEDERAVKQLAMILHYYPEQLQEDMEAIEQYITQIEQKIEE